MNDPVHWIPSNCHWIPVDRDEMSYIVSRGANQWHPSRMYHFSSGWKRGQKDRFSFEPTSTVFLSMVPPAALTIALSLGLHLTRSISAQCCGRVEVVGGGKPKEEIPSIFTTYTLQPTLLNGYVFYASRSGTRALAWLYNSNNNWVIQDASDR